MIHPRFWTEKPPTGVQINWGHPLAQGLVACLCYQEGVLAYDLVQRRFIVPTGATPTLTVAGPGLNFDGTDDELVVPEFLAAMNPDGLSGSKSFFSRCRVDVLPAFGDHGALVAGFTTSGGAPAAGFAGVGIDSTGMIIHHEQTKTVTFDVFGPADLVTTGRVVSVGASVQIPGVAVAYLNGVPGSPGFLGEATSFGSTPVLRVGGTTVVTAGHGFGSWLDGQVFYTLAYARALSVAEMAWLHAEPYAIFLPPAVRRRYIYQAPAPPAFPGAMGTTFRALAEHVGGELVYDLFHLSVTAPVFQAWYLAAQDLEAGALYGDSPAYRGLVVRHSGAPGVSALGGQSQEASITLEISDHIGSGGPGRRFSDGFATPVSVVDPTPALTGEAEEQQGRALYEQPVWGGQSAEPYDLQTMALAVHLAWGRGGDEKQRLQVGRFRLRPDGAEWSETPPIFRLTFGPDDWWYRALPRQTLSIERYPHLPPESDGQAVPLCFGRALDVPCLPVDQDGGLYLIGASPEATPITAVSRLWIIRKDDDPEKAHNMRLPLAQTTSGETVLTVAGNGTARDLHEVSQRIKLTGAGVLAASVRVWLRRKVAGTPGVGVVSLEAVRGYNLMPSFEPIDQAGAGEIDAALVSSGTFAPYDLLFRAEIKPRATYLPPDRGVWVIVRYANNGGGDLQIEVDSTGAYTRGLLAYRDTTEDAWILTGTKVTRGPVALDYTGLGHLLKRPDAPPQELSEESTDIPPITVEPPAQIGQDRKGLYVGDSLTGTWRAFARFHISDLAGAVTAARLEWHFLDRANPVANAVLVDIADFGAEGSGAGTLDANDWGSVERAVITATAITPSTEEDTELEWDVTTRYNQAKTDGLTHFAVMLRSASEGSAIGKGEFYVVGAAAPSLVLTVTAGEDLRLEVRATQVAVELARLDGLGTRAATVTIGDTTSPSYPPAGEGIALAATVDGMNDVIGNYTGTPGAVIESGADILRWLATAPKGLALHANQVDLDALTRSRDALTAMAWPNLAVYLATAADAREWFALIARCCETIYFLDQTGKLSIYTDRFGVGAASVVRCVQPWEHGPVRFSAMPGLNGAVYPATRVEVYYGPDRLGLSEEAKGYLGYAMVSADETTPADPSRQSQAVQAVARYGYRQLAEFSVGVPAIQPAFPSDPGGDHAYDGLPLESTPGELTGIRQRNMLWDRNWARVRPADALEVSLPRFALGWRLMQEFEGEFYQAPSAAARLLPGAQAWSLETEMADASNWYMARRARCRVQAIQLTAQSGADFPVQVTAQILGWDTP